MSVWNTSDYDTPFSPPPMVASAPVITRSQPDDQSVFYLPFVKARLGISEANRDFDAGLTQLIGEAVSQVEQYTSLSLRPQRISVSYARYDGQVLPCGPVWADPAPVVVARNDGATVTITDQTGQNVSGDAFPVLDRFRSGAVSYHAGYSVRVAPLESDEDDNDTTTSEYPTPHPYPLPGGLLGAVVDYVASSFRSGGVTGGNADTGWKIKAAPFRRFDS